MPVYTLRAPDGREIDIKANDEATARRGAQEWYASQPAKPAKRVPPTAADARGQRIVDLGNLGPPTSPKARQAVAKLPVGAFYRDYQGNVRRNDNGPRFLTDPKAGNPVVPIGGASDAGRSLLRGIGEGVQSLIDPDLIGDAAKMFGLKPTQSQAMSPLDVLQSASFGGRALGRQMAGDTSGAQRDVASARANTGQGRNLSQGGGYAAQTALGRGFQSAGQLLPGAAFPASIPVRIASVAAPLIAGEAAANIGGAMGADRGTQENLRLGGQLAGGLASAVRLKVPAPNPPDPALVQALLQQAPIPAGVSRSDYNKALAYVERLARGAGATPESIAAVSGRGVTAAEAVGRPAQSGLGALAIREGQTGPAFEARIAARQIARPERLLGDVAEAGGIDPTFARGDMEALTAAGQRQAAPLYAAAEAQMPATSSRLEDLLQRPTIRDAFKEAQRMARNAGDDPNALGLVDMETPGAFDRQLPPDAPSVAAAVPRGLQGGQSSQGPSLAKFIADGGGVKDATGELSAMDMDAFHRGKPFQRKLIGDADSLDGWAQRAWERGYFPGDEPPTPNQLLDALADEARGRPRFAREADPNVGQRQAFLEAEAERVARGGDAPVPSPDDYMGGPMPFNEPVAAQMPSWKALDLLKKAADKQINAKYRNPLTGKLDASLPGAREEIAVVAQLRDEIVKLNPRYGEALNVAGEYLSANSAYEFGQEALFRPQFDARDFAARVAKMTEAEVKAVRSGIANDILKRMMNGYLRPALFKTPAVRAKLEAAFGREETNKLLRAMESEAAMLAFEGRYAPGAGPKSAEMLEAMRAQDEGGAMAGNVIDFGTTALTQGKSAAISEVVRKVGTWAKTHLQTRGMSVPTRDIAGDILMDDPQRLAAILKLRQVTRPQGLRVPQIGYQIPGASSPVFATQPPRRVPR